MHTVFMTATEDLQRITIWHSLAGLVVYVPILVLCSRNSLTEARRNKQNHEQVPNAKPLPKDASSLSRDNSEDLVAKEP